MRDLDGLFDEYLDGQAFKGVLDDFEEFIMGVVFDSYLKTKEGSLGLYPDVYIGIVNGYNFNARAFKYEGHYFIGLNIGLIRIVKNFYNYLFSRTDVFKKVDCSKESNPEININLSDIDNYVDTIGDLFNKYEFEEIVPRSDRRKKHAQIYAANAVTYLFLHEYGHIVNGHLDYSISKGKKFVFFESSNKRNGGLINQCLEMDADSFAASKNIGLVNDPEFWSGAALTTGFAAIFIHQLLSTKIDAFDKLEDYSHPIPAIRQMIYVNMVYSFFSQFGNKFAGDLSDHIIKILLPEYVNVFRDILGLEKESLTLTSIDKKEVKQHFNAIMFTWNEIHDDLEKYAFGHIAPINKWPQNLE